MISRVKDEQLFKEKLRMYLTYLSNGTDYWIGQDLKAVHKKFKISDELFDAFIACFRNAFKDKSVKKISMPTFKEIIQKMQSLRTEIVHN